MLHPVEIFPGIWRYPYAQIEKIATAGCHANGEAVNDPMASAA